MFSNLESLGCASLRLGRPAGTLQAEPLLPGCELSSEPGFVADNAGFDQVGDLSRQPWPQSLRKRDRDPKQLQKTLAEGQTRERACAMPNFGTFVLFPSQQERNLGRVYVWPPKRSEVNVQTNLPTTVP